MTRYFIRRLVRCVEIWRIFGIRDRITWQTLFPPFRGWDVGCGYCALIDLALAAKRCRRAERMHYEKCGILDMADATESDKGEK